MGLTSANGYLRTIVLDMGLPMSISGKPQLTDNSFISEYHVVMNPFCAISHLLTKDSAAISNSRK